jgi:hypothetical protein
MSTAQIIPHVAPLNAARTAQRAVPTKNGAVQMRPTGAEVASTTPMQPINFIALLEEMVDLKVQQHTLSHLKTTPEIGMVLAQKRETDRRRLDQIRAELIRVLTG